MNNGCPKCHQNEFIEYINQGIKQEVYYRNGYIVKEITTFDTEEEDCFVVCQGCKTKYNEYEL